LYESKESVVFNQKPALCRICKEGGGLLVSRDSEKLTITGNPDHPVSKGFICFRGAQFGNVHDSPERLSSPLRKVKSGWRTMSYEDAIDLLAEKLRRSKQESGAQSICFYKGESLKHQESTAYLRHLCNGLGSANYQSVGSICHFAMALGHGLTYGGIPTPDYSRIQSAVSWGCNPANSLQRTFRRLKEAKMEGLRLIVIDPSRTSTAELADLHLAITPGTDGYLALAFLKQLTKQDGLPPEAATFAGWEQMSRELDGLSLDSLLRPTGIDMNSFLAAVDLLTANRPSWIQTGLGLELQPHGVQTIRAIACLQAVLDPHFRLPVPWGKLQPLPGSDSYPESISPLGSVEFPLFTGKKGEGQAMRLPRAILEGDPYPIRTMLIAGANPMLTFPNPALFGKALDRLDFLAVFDLFMTETAKRADLVLPAATHLEYHELHDYVVVGQPYLGLVQPVEDSGRGWPLWKLVFELAKRLDLGPLFPWQDNRQALSERMSGSGIEYGELAESPTLTARYVVNESGSIGRSAAAEKINIIPRDSLFSP
jgi:anaerobic selenocysteine-containing dehydrogenase